MNLIGERDNTNSISNHIERKSSDSPISLDSSLSYAATFSKLADRLAPLIFDFVFQRANQPFLLCQIGS